MSRALFKQGGQREFFEEVLTVSGLTYNQLANEYGKSVRTFRDWQREKFHADFEIVKDLSKRFSVPMRDVKTLDTYWYARKGATKGALARMKLHGPLGTEAGRRKGGQVSQKRRLKNPDYYRALGCKVRNEFKSLYHSESLAELCGILLGDGGVTNNQVTVSLDKTTDKDYAEFVRTLMDEITGRLPSVYTRNNVRTVVLSGVNLVVALEAVGLLRGNKILNEVRIPQWIKSDKVYARACVRGLFDTDGSLYRHRKIKKTYMGWTFTSRSLPLLEDVGRILHANYIKVKLAKADSLYLYNKVGIDRYMRVFGSHNPKHVKKFQKYMEGCAEW